MAETGRPTATVQELATLVQGKLQGDGSVVVQGLAPVFQATSSELGLLSDHRYLDDALASQAGALLVAADLVEKISAPQVSAMIVVDRPQEALPALLGFFHPPPVRPATIHPTAVLGRGVTLGEDVTIGPYAVLEEGVTVGARTRIGAQCFLGADAALGEDCELFPQVVVYARSVLGNRVMIQSGARVGADGFGYVFKDGEHQKVPQVGACVLEDDVEVGANVTIDRGSIGRTVIGRGSKIDNQVQIGHNVTIGPLTIVVSQVGISGSAQVGSGVILAGQVGVGGHVRIGDGVTVGGQSGVTDDLPPGSEVYWGTPAHPITGQKRSLAIFHKLPNLSRRVRALEKRLDEGEE